MERLWKNCYYTHHTGSLSPPLERGLSLKTIQVTAGCRGGESREDKNCGARDSSEKGNLDFRKILADGNILPCRKIYF